MDHRCPQCASVQLTRVRDLAFAFEWRCHRCTRVFVTPMISVVLIDANERRRVELVSCLTREGIPVIAATCLSDLETWPIGKVLVTDVRSFSRFETGARHVVVLADSDEERAAARIADGSTTVVMGEPASLLATLRTIAQGNRGVGPDTNNGVGDRRNGPPERRRHTRRDRRAR
jgi:hypothetical protein